MVLVIVPATFSHTSLGEVCSFPIGTIPRTVFMFHDMSAPFPPRSIFPQVKGLLMPLPVLLVPITVCRHRQHISSSPSSDVHFYAFSDSVCCRPRVPLPTYSPITDSRMQLLAISSLPAFWSHISSWAITHVQHSQLRRSLHLLVRIL
jgi:hypothetical protein